MLSIVFMNKRSILTAVLALGLGVTALTGCATDSDSAHSYVTPKDVKTVERPIAQIDDSGIKVPEKRDLKIKLADSDKAAKWTIDVSDPTALEVGKSEKNIVTLHPLRALGEEDDPVTVTLTTLRAQDLRILGPVRCVEAVRCWMLQSIDKLPQAAQWQHQVVLRSRAGNKV